MNGNISIPLPLYILLSKFLTIMKNRIFTTILIVFTVIALTSCDKEKSDAKKLLGTWVNTEESWESTIAGATQRPAGTIALTFEHNRVYVVDSRCDCLPEWHHYSLTRKDGELIMNINNWRDNSKVSELSNDKLVLSDDRSIIDAGYGYTFKKQ